MANIFDKVAEKNIFEKVASESAPAEIPTWKKTVSDVAHTALPMVGGIGGSVLAAPGIVSTPAGGILGMAAGEAGARGLDQLMGLSKDKGLVEEAKTVAMQDIPNAAIAEMGGQVIGKALSTVFKPKTTFQIKNEIDKSIEQGISKGIRPLVKGKSTSPMMKAYNEKAKEAVNTIIDNKDTLKFVRENQEVVGELPTSLKEFSDAISQTKLKLWNDIDKMAKVAGGRESQGFSVDLTKIADKLDDIAKDKSVLRNNPSVAEYARSYANRLRQDGVIDAVEAQKDLMQVNAKLDAYYASGGKTEGALNNTVDAVVGNNLREMIDDVITQVQGPGYRNLRNKYAALKTLEKEVAQRAVVDARKNVKGLIDYTDIYSGAEAIRALATGNIPGLASATTMQVIKNYIKATNEPSRIISSMFADVAKKRGMPIKQKYPDIATGIAGRMAAMSGVQNFRPEE